MNLWEFLPLDKAARKEVVFAKGVYIASRIATPYTFLLFSVEDFYIEMVYHKDSAHFEGFIAFSTRSPRLEPYISHVKLGSLFATINGSLQKTRP